MCADLRDFQGSWQDGMRRLALQGDPGIQLFSACLRAGAPIAITPGMRVLEVGCCEADWLHLAHAVWPETHFVGIDVRCQDVTDGDGMVTRMCADVLNADLFAPASFDAVVSLSAIEHVGLGHYRDPVDANGDRKAIANISHWLKPGGWVYFDVPYDPSGFRVDGTKCRVYDRDAHDERLFNAFGTPTSPWANVLFRGFADANRAGSLIEAPRESVDPFHYCAMVWQKP